MPHEPSGTQTLYMEEARAIKLAELVRFQAIQEAPHVCRRRCQTPGKGR